MHAAVLSPDEKRLFFTDLGTDKINIYRYRDSRVPALTPESPAFTSVKAGTGPRHMDFSADGKFMYAVQELTAEITAYSVDDAKLTAIQTVPMTLPDFKGSVGAADIHISPNGQFLYASNRGDANEIVAYAINPTSGQLTFIERVNSMGKTPRNFMIEPNGKFLLVANQNTNSVNVMSIDQKTGRLSPTRSRIDDISMPVCLKMVAVE